MNRILKVGLIGAVSCLFMAQHSETIMARRPKVASGANCASCVIVRNTGLQQGGTAPVGTFSSNTAAHFIIATVEANIPSSTPVTLSIADTALNTYAPVGSAVILQNGGQWQQQQIFLVASCAASAIPNVLTVSASGGSYFALFGGEYTGNVGAVTADGNNGANGYPSPASSGTFTISANDLVIGWSVQSGTTTTAGSGFTDRSGANFFMYEDGVFAGTTGNATATGVTDWQMLGQAFK